MGENLALNVADHGFAVLPQNLTQAQRDFVGAHTYQRVDHPEAGRYTPTGAA